MDNEIVYVKNMVCNRCIMVVEQTFLHQGIIPTKVNLGEVYLQKKLGYKEKENLKTELYKHGFSLIDDKKGQLINSIKSLVISWIHEFDFKTTPLKFSVFISQNLKKDYRYLSNVFSEVEGYTIEQYLILNRIEKVKEFLLYDELSLNEIALKTGFSSGAHLSVQFKKVTKLTPTHFKNIKENKRKPIDEL